MLKKTVFAGCLFLLLACNNSETITAATEGDVDAARTFIRAALDGNYKVAQNLIVPDSANKEWLATAERSYLHDSLMSQRGLRESSIVIHDTKKLNDSTSVITYSNSFRNKKQTLKTIRQGGTWRVDLKYTFQPADSAGK